MHKAFIKTAAVFGAVCVVLGAFASHTLKQHISGEAVSIFETGVRYQFYHVFALFTAGILYKDFRNKFIKWSGIFFIAGIILFSGSLYLLTYIKGTGMQRFNWVGVITPLGGLSFILGWICLFTGLLKK
jgi:uncharacterized membrane protein YgdD (TMEM256/DUF423 family)